MDHHSVIIIIIYSQVNANGPQSLHSVCACVWTCDIGLKKKYFEAFCVCVCACNLIHANIQSASFLCLEAFLFLVSVDMTFDTLQGCIQDFGSGGQIGQIKNVGGASEL